MNFFEKITHLPDAIKGQLFCDPERNGEYKFLKSFLSTKKDCLIFDVGANIGEYSEQILRIKNNVAIYCFEPVLSTFIKLSENLGKYSNVILNNFALGERNGDAEIFIYSPEAGINSLYYNEKYTFNTDTVITEKIQLKTIDTFINENKISKVDLLKIDVEGNELNVLKGAKDSIENGLIKIIQFEYNDYWKKSEFKLEEVFELLSIKSFKFFRLTPWGKIYIPKFRNTLENFKHSNYMAFYKE